MIPSLNLKKDWYLLSSDDEKGSTRYFVSALISVDAVSYFKTFSKYGVIIMFHSVPEGPFCPQCIQAT